MLSFSLLLQENEITLGDVGEATARTGLVGLGSLLTLAGISNLNKNILPDLNFAGREKYYHSTVNANEDSIKNNGLHVSTEENVRNTKELKYDPERYKKSLGHVYLSKEPTREYGPSVIEVRLPKGKFTPVMNPEVDMPFSEYVRKAVGEDSYRRLIEKGEEKAGVSEARLFYDRMRNSIVYPHNIPAEYIVGPKFKTPGFSEVLHNFKTNRDHFMHNLKYVSKGSLPVIGGISAIGLGALGSLNKDK